MRESFANHLHEPLPTGRADALLGHPSRAIQSDIGWLQVREILNRFPRLQPLVSQCFGGQHTLVKESTLLDYPMHARSIVASLADDVPVLIMNARDQRDGLDAVL